MKLALIVVGTIGIIYNCYWLIQGTQLRKQASQNPDNQEIPKSLKQGDLVSRVSLALVAIVYSIYMLNK